MIKLVAFDFDGVFTDGKFYFNNESKLYKSYNGKDSFSLNLLKEQNIKTGIITNDKEISIEYAPHIFNRLNKYSIGSNKPKIEILDEWLTEYNLTFNEVAYIGDDLPDIDILRNVKFSACPNDAVDNVKKICNYICKKNGGDGVVREFVEKVLEINKNFDYSEVIDSNINNDGKITAVIPVRKGSTRCKRKNIRNFSDTNLLKLKIETLKKVKGIDEIIVSTDCDNMIKLALDLNVKIHKRENYFASSNCPNYEYWNHIAKNVGIYNNFMMVNAVSPLVNSNTIDKFINKFIKNNYKNMVTVHKQKKFFCNSENTKGINFDSEKSPNSQDLFPLSEITFGICIATREQIMKHKCIYGKNPVFFDLDNIESIDIDENSDFIQAELLHRENIINDDICKMILENRVDRPESVDCTIRDGGYLNNWEHTDDEVLECYKSVTKAGIDYFEIGFRTNKDLLKGKGKWCYSKEEDINRIVNQYKGTKICVMAKIGTFTIEDFIEKKNSNVDMVRVLVARSSVKNNIKISEYNEKDLLEAKQICLELLGFGYEVCLNLGCGDLIVDKEIQLIISIFHDVEIKTLYLADTYGGFNSNTLPKQIHNFYKQLDLYNSNLKLGLHIHNNNGDGLEKAKIAYFHGCNMIDSSINGLGRGSGNLKTEEYLHFISKNIDEYIQGIKSLLIFYEKFILSKKVYNKNKIQHHIYYNIAGKLSLHPDYILEILRNEDSKVEDDIDLILKLNKYTIENNCRNYDNKLIERLKK